MYHTMFSFEGSLGRMKKDIHGTRGFSEQLLKKSLNKQRLTQSAVEYLNSDSHNEDIGNLLSDWLLLERNYKNTISICSPIIERIANEFEIEHLELPFNTRVLVSNKLIKYKEEYHSMDYNKVFKSCSFKVKFRHDNQDQYGSMCYFLQIEDEFYACISIFMDCHRTLVSNLKGRPMNVFSDLIKNKSFEVLFKTMKETEEFVVINVKAIKNKCITINTNKENIFYITDFINENEHD